MKILFLHGWQSVPGGVKPTYLARHSHEVINPALPHEDFAEAVRIAQAEFDRHQPQVVVGSSRGGAVTMNINSNGAKLVLLCPAWRKYGTARTVKPGTVILHSRADDVVPFGDSEELIRKSGLPETALVEVGGDHRLADPEPLAAMLKACLLPETNTTVPLRDRFLGCLLGCAVGDALGAPHEGLWPQQIPDKKWLLSDFIAIEGYPKGQFTDDTQLSVATVQSLVRCGELSLPHVARSIARLWKRQLVIGPGGACTYAAHAFLRTADWTTCGAAVGQAGNGTAMRTAVLGLYFLEEPERLPAAVAAVSKITHHDPRSIAGGVAMAKAAQLLASDQADSATAFCTAIAATMEPHEGGFAEMVRRLPELLDQSPEEALPRIAWAGMERPEFQQPIITPFVIPTVLASLWCLLQSPDSWSEAVARAIRLGGDVDTLGAIVGALAGAKLGVSAIPRPLVDGVLDSEKLQALAVRYHARAISRKS